MIMIAMFALFFFGGGGGFKRGIGWGRRGWEMGWGRLGWVGGGGRWVDAGGVVGRDGVGGERVGRGERERGVCVIFASSVIFACS